MGPLAEGILGTLMTLRRVSTLLVGALVLFILWLAARRAGRRGLDLAVLLLGAAVVAFAVAVFAQRPPMTEAAAVALVLIAAFLIVVTFGVILHFGLRRRRPTQVVKHKTPPWEEGGW